jgi:capsular polysaccharide biosynthesis protein/predicted TIM-barrel fold metal-dependent hydrolase
MEPVELGVLGRGIQRRWRLVAGLGLLGGVVGITVSLLLTPVYQARTSLLVGETLHATQVDTRALKASQSIAHAYADIIPRRPVMEAVVDTLRLPTSWQQLARRIRVDLPANDPQLIVVTVQATSTEQAEAIAGAVADQLLAVSSSRVAAEKRAFEAGQLTALQHRIQAADSRVADLRKRQGAAKTPQERASLQGQIDDAERVIQDWQRNYANLAALRPPDSASTSVEILERAHAAPTPVSPRTNTNVLLSVGVGVMVAVPVVFLLERRRPHAQAPATSPPAWARRRSNGRLPSSRARTRRPAPVAEQDKMPADRRHGRDHAVLELGDPPAGRKLVAAADGTLADRIVIHDEKVETAKPAEVDGVDTRANLAQLRTGSRGTSTALDLSEIPFVDQRCRGLLARPLDRSGFVRFLTESPHPLPHGGSWFDTPLGFAVRRWCPPLLGLGSHASPEEYLERRAELGAEEVTSRLLQSTGISDYLVDAGPVDSLLGPSAIAAVSGARAHEVVRLEALAEQVARDGTSADGFAAVVTDALQEAARTAVAVKSVAAHRHGLDLDPDRPSAREVRAAAAAWFRDIEATGEAHLADPVLLRHLLWAALDTGLPLQVETGFCATDLTLNHADPALLAPFLRATQPSGADVVLLPGYPFHRNAAYLAQVFPNVYVDVGLTPTSVGTRADTLLAETLELAPFTKVLFSTDAYGLPELYVVGAARFREHLYHLFAEWGARDVCTAADAARVARLIAGNNARDIYRLT